MRLSTSSKAIRVITLTMIIIGLASVVLSTFHFMKPYRRLLGFEAFVGAAYFAVEYCMRIHEALRGGQRKSLFKYLFSFMGIVDLLAILPFLVPVFFPSESTTVTVMIYCRLVLIFKLRRYSTSFNLLSEAINSVRKPLAVAITLPLLLALISALFFYYVEAPLQPDKLKNITDAFYWVIITMATVGYGDLVPVSEVGKVLSVLTALSGVFIIAIPSGLLSSAFINILHSNRTRPKGRNMSSSRAATTHVSRADITRLSRRAQRLK